MDLSRSARQASDAKTSGSHRHTSVPREVYIDAFRGLMALVMVQGHVCDTLLAAVNLGDPAYQWQVRFHGSTAPGFLFASGFVAGLPRAPLSLRASLRRARRLLYVLGVGYALHLPYLCLWKTLAASPAQQAALLACDALQIIAVTQLAVLGIQWMAGRRWTWVTGALGVAILVSGQWVWTSGLAARLPPWLGTYLDRSVGSQFPIFPFSAFVLAGTVAGAAIGRREPASRHRRMVWAGTALLVLGSVLALLLEGVVEFWGVSPAYALIRLGGLLLLLRLVEAVADASWPGVSILALLGHETLLVYVVHLAMLYGGTLGPSPIYAYAGSLSFGATFVVLGAMVPLLVGAAAGWRRLKARAPHEAQALLVFGSTWFALEFLLRPW